MDKSNMQLKVWYVLSIIMVIWQIAVKFAVEIPNATGTESAVWLVPFVWVLTAGWLVLLPLNIMKHRLSFLWSAIFGFLRVFMGPMAPLSGTCDHWVAGPAVGVQGLIIGVVCLITYRIMETASAPLVQES
jgi:hypothetical protein